MHWIPVRPGNSWLMFAVWDVWRPKLYLEIRSTDRSCTRPKDIAPNVTSSAAKVEVSDPSFQDIGSRRSAAHLRAAILDPGSTLPEGFLAVRLVTKDGRRISGVRLNEDIFTIQVRDLNGGIHSFFKEDLKELQKDTGKSPMPSYPRNVFSVRSGRFGGLSSFLAR